MPANDELFDAEVSHAVHLERLKARQAREIQQLIANADEQLTTLVRARIAQFAEVGQSLSPAKRKQLEATISRILDRRARVFVEVDKTLTQEILDLARYEIEFQRRLIEQVIPIVIELQVPQTAQLLAAVRSRPFEGRILREWLSDIGRADGSRVAQVIRQGVTEGRTIDEMVRAIRGTRAARYRDGILDITRRNAEAVVRTATNHTVSAARDELFASNADIIKAVRWTSTLDGRTTAICQARDGQEYPLRSGPRPPAHWNCRSTVVPVLDGVGIIGNRPTVTDTRTRERREISFRKQAKERYGDDWKGLSEKAKQDAVRAERQKWQRENIGQITADTSYQQWLKRQPAGFQDEVLGKTKGKLFRAGAPLDKFVDKSGHEYTLKELRRRDASLFERAGIAD